MAGPIRTVLTPLTDSSGGSGGSVYQAATWNVPYYQIADLFDSHVLNASQSGAAVVQHKDIHILANSDYSGVTPRSYVLVTGDTVRIILEELIAAWCEIVGVASTAFHTATVPATLAGLNTIVANRNPAAVANTIVERDAGADVYARSFIAGGVLYAGAAVLPLTDGTTGKVLNSALAASFAATVNNLALRDGNGDITFRDVYGRSIIASAGGALYGATARQITDATTGFILPAALPVLPTYLIDNVAPSPTGAALTMAWTTGYTTDGAGVAHQVAAGSVTYAPPNPTTQANWALTYLSTGGAVTTIYAIAANSNTPSTTLPASAIAIIDAYLPINAAGVIQTQAAWSGGTHPFFIDGRARSSQGGGGGATIYTAASPLAETAISDSGASGSLEDYLSASVSGDLAAAITVSGGTLSVKVNPGKQPLTFKLAGFGRKVVKSSDSPATYSTNTVSAQDSYILVADLNAAGAKPNFYLQTSVSAGQIALWEVDFDGSTLYDASPHGPVDHTKPVIGGGNFQPWQQFSGRISASAIAANPSLPLVYVPGFPTLTFNLPAGVWQVKAKWGARMTNPASPGDFRLYAMYASGVGVFPTTNALPQFIQWSGQGANSVVTGYTEDVLLNQGKGATNWTLGYTASLLGHTLTDVFLRVEVTRQ